jgi:lipoate-protein ligase A
MYFAFDGSRCAEDTQASYGESMYRSDMRYQGSSRKFALRQKLVQILERLSLPRHDHVETKGRSDAYFEGIKITGIAQDRGLGHMVDQGDADVCDDGSEEDLSTKRIVIMHRNAPRVQSALERDQRHLSVSKHAT